MIRIMDLPDKQQGMRQLPPQACLIPTKPIKSTIVEIGKSQERPRNIQVGNIRSRTLSRLRKFHSAVEIKAKFKIG